MNKYQLLYIIDNGIGDEQKAELVEKFSELITSLGGEIESVEKWGTKRYAYLINDKKEGYYVLVKFAANGDIPAEIERKMSINDSIVRQMITRQV